MITLKIKCTNKHIYLIVFCKTHYLFQISTKDKCVQNILNTYKIYNSKQFYILSILLLTKLNEYGLNQIHIINSYYHGKQQLLIDTLSKNKIKLK